MPVALRKRLNCHYCGHRSKHTPGSRVARFQCEFCLAVNFFDDKGEIADVPLNEVSSTEHFAQPVRADPLADNFSAQDSIFCSTCLKNQLIYTHTLANYLPDSDHPDYERLEEELPAYKKQLDQRYPQCCAMCEPKVRAQLEKTTYAARTDHLRRLMHKSRQRRLTSPWGWRSLLVNAAGLAYFVSLSAQVFWHLYGSQITDMAFVVVVRPSDCFQQRSFSAQCLDMAEPLVGLSLVLGLLSVWWNPKWKYKLLNYEARLTGLHEYHLVQLVLLALRLIAWIVMFHLPIPLRSKAMLHACFAVALMVLSGWSVSSIVKVRLQPPINWHQDPAPLLTRNHFQSTTGPEPLETQRSLDTPFSINTLGHPVRPTYDAWNVPTPSPDASEAMDWTPSQPVFRPDPKQVRYTTLDSTPFHGTLPALNARGIHKNPSQAQTGRQAIGLPPGFFDKPVSATLPSRQVTDAGEAMAPPKFFGRIESDTGLESIFNSVFSIRDRSSAEDLPRSTTASQRAQSRQVQASQVPTNAANTSSSRIFSAIAILCALVLLAIWIFEAAVSSGASALGYYFVLLSTAIPIGHVLGILCFQDVQNQLASLVLYTFEAGILISVALTQDLFGDLFHDLWNKLAIAIVALLLPQEFLALSRSYSSSAVRYNASARSAPTSRTGRAANERAGDELSRSYMRAESVDSVPSPSSPIKATDPWDSPRRDNIRFDYMDTVDSQRSTRPPALAASTRTMRSQHTLMGDSSRAYDSRPSDRPMYGMDGMERHYDGYDRRLPRDESTGITNVFGHALNLSAPSPRVRRRL